MKASLAQINPLVGDIGGNADKIITRIQVAKKIGVHLVAFPELAICGYPPKDLLLRDGFADDCQEAIELVAKECVGITAVIGTVMRNHTAVGRELYNAAAVCSDGLMQYHYCKRLLPTYDIFDERRYFEPGQGSLVVPIFDGKQWRRVGILICEDIWNEELVGRKLYHGDPVAETIAAGADTLVCISASPFCVGKPALREDLLCSHVIKYGTPIIFVNQTGGNDDLVFDGNSAVIWPSKRGIVPQVATAGSFREDLMMIDLDKEPPGGYHHSAGALDDLEAVRNALVLGVRDYVRKCGFSDVVIGLSGGIDSALTAAVAVEALGADHVHGVAMPSRHSSDHSVDDAKTLADNLEIDFRVVMIEPAHAAFEAMLAGEFTGREEDVTEENIQARVRGNILMALSNKFGWLVLTTGNKSELAVGYCTLYGDMCGGLAVISDVPKTMVYDLSRHINHCLHMEIIPNNTIDKPASAELKPGQMDQDSLPPYEVLDLILRLYVEERKSPDDIWEALGGAVLKTCRRARNLDDERYRNDPNTIQREQLDDVIRRVDRNEYKRKQAAPGLRVTSQAFGTGWRFPIAAKIR